MSVVSLLPIAIIIALIILIIVINVSAKFVTVKVTHWLLIIYSGVLLLSLIIVMIVSEESGISHEKVGEDIRQNKNEIYHLLSEGKVDEINPRYLVNKSNFEYRGKRLAIIPSNGAGPDIFIKRKQVDDNMIEASIYGNILLINGYDYTNMLEPINLTIDSDNHNLHIMFPNQDINLSIVKSEFPINQFTKQTKFINGIEHISPVVYLSIPKSLRLIVSNNLYFENIEVQTP